MKAIVYREYGEPNVLRLEKVDKGHKRGNVVVTIAH